MPLILVLAENRDLNRAEEGVYSFPQTLLSLKRNPHTVRILLIPVDHHEGPLPVRTPQRIRRYQRVACSIRNVALRGKHQMLAVARLHPLQVDELRGEELGERLLNLVAGVNREHPERPGRVVAAVLHLQRQIMEEI